MSWQALGDEGALLARDGALVAAGGSRRAAVEALVACGATVVVLDDGLGPHGVDVNVGIEVVDARFPEARGPLPVGERRPRQRRADFVVWTHVDHRFPAPAGALVAVARPGPWQPFAPRGPVAAVAGLGRQADLLRFGDLCVDRFRALADHQAVDRALAGEICRWADGLPVVTTAKDAVRWEGDVTWRDVEVTCVGPGLDRL
jgi:tetraacyldisaccharide-1-P 4'-kinase